MKLILVLLTLLLVVSPALAQESVVRETIVYTLATNDNALRYAVISSLTTTESMYQTGEVIVSHYITPTLPLVSQLPFSKEEQLLLYSHLMMWKHLGQLMMNDAVGLPIDRHLYWADFWYSFYHTALLHYATQYNWTQDDLDKLWNTERFGPDPRVRQKLS